MGLGGSAGALAVVPWAAVLSWAAPGPASASPSTAPAPISPSPASEILRRSGSFT